MSEVIANIVKDKFYILYTKHYRGIKSFHLLIENLRDDPEFKTVVNRAQDNKAAIRVQAPEMVAKGVIDL